MIYIIMCGGDYPKFDKPRWMLPFKGECIVERTIRLLREHGVDDISISSNDDRLERFGVPVIRHNNSYVSWGYNDSKGYWCDAFYLTESPVCYLFGDVIYSQAAIKAIVETGTDDVAFFGSAPPFSIEYPKLWIEPFCFKVVNTQHFKQAIADVKRLQDAGRFGREPIAWEVWNVISRGADGDVNTIDHDSYIHINDWTTDIDKPEEIYLLEKLAGEE